MKEKDTTTTLSNKKKIVYSIVLAACVLLLTAAIVLTVYFVTNKDNPVLDAPPVTDPTDPAGPSDPGNPDQPGDPTGPSDPADSDDPNDPTGGEGRVAYKTPIEAATCSVEYYAIYNNTTLDKWTRHLAMDFSAAEGTAVCAIGDGKVISISASSELGNVIEVEHEGGIVSLYRFVEPVAGLTVGQTVEQGQKIAEVASAYGTEAKDGTHLHLEMKLGGKNVDPSDYLDVTLEEK